MVPTSPASLAGWATSGASSHLTDLELGCVICRPRGNKRTLLKRGLCWTAHTSRLLLISQNPIRLFKANCVDCRGHYVCTWRHTVLEQERSCFCCEQAPRSIAAEVLIRTVAQGSFMLILLPSSVRSMSGIPQGLHPKQSCLHLSFITE